MITLVIHPDDRSTDFLKPIYKNVKNLLLVTKQATHKDIISLIETSGRVIMLGHGSPSGLFGINFGRDFVIDHTCVKALSKKKDNAMYVWCNADKFVERHNLSGMYSGMFISEVAEANYCGLKNISQEQVNSSNNYFAEICSNLINEPLGMAYSKIKSNYEHYSQNNLVAHYNSRRFYYK